MIRIRLFTHWVNRLHATLLCLPASLQFLNICVFVSGTAEDVERFNRRTVKVTKQHNEECQKLLRLMGIPVVIVRVKDPHHSPQHNVHCHPVTSHFSGEAMPE